MKTFSLFSLFILSLNLPVHAVTLTMMGNQGVVISADNDVVVIDALYEHYSFWEGFSYDKSLLDDQKLNALAGKSLAFAATHVHRDHFHPQLTGKQLDVNKNSVFIGGKQTVESIKEDFINEHRIRDRVICLASVSCEPTYPLSETTSVQGIITTHNHNSYDWVENTAMLVITGNKRILHLGDASLSEENIKTLKAAIEKPDAVLIPYWFVMNQDFLKKFVEALKPEIVLVTHFPKEQYQQLKDFFAPVAENLKTEFNEIRFEILQPGSSLSL